MAEHRIFDMPVAEVYPHYVAKLERKGRDVEQLDVVIEWLTGYSSPQIATALANKTSFRDFFADARINPAAELITGKICGVTIQEIDDPLMKNIRYLDKMVDEVGNGRPLEKVLRQPPQSGV
jgi:hypothetical protein